MAKTVTIKSGMVFKSLKAAKEHFGEIRKEAPLGEMLPEPHRSDLIDIYLRYCKATNWSAQGAIDITTSWENDKRPGDRYAQTKAFAVVAASGEQHIFSVDRALEAVAE